MQFDIMKRERENYPHTSLKLEKCTIQAIFRENHD